MKLNIRQLFPPEADLPPADRRRRIFLRQTFFIWLIVPAIIFTVEISRAAAQKKTPPTAKTALQDTIVKDIRTDVTQPMLRTLDFKEYTILGMERMRVLPTQRKAIVMADITSRERISTSVEKSEHRPPGAGGEKVDRSFELPMIGLINEAYAAFGKYTDINAGIRLNKKHIKDEFFGDFDFHRNSGHIFNANFYKLTGNVANIHEFNDRIQSKTELLFNVHEYKFYGAQTTPNEKRKGFNVDLLSEINITQWEAVDIWAESGGRFVNPDDSKIFNWDLWSRVNLSSIVYSTYVNGSFEMNTDRVKDGAFDNAPLSEANYARAQLTVERLVMPRLHLRVGGTYTHYYSNNANNVYSFQNNILTVLKREIQIREDNKFYPLAALTYDMDDLGRLFIELEPKIEPFTMLEKLRQNPFLELTSPLSYENTSHSVKLGWKRSYAYDLAFEIFYNDKRIKNYGILVDRGLGFGGQPEGRWSYDYNNVLDVNEYRGIVNWSPYNMLNVWGSISYIDYTVVESIFAEYVPYMPNFTFDFTLNFMPGYGFQLIVDGQYIGKRYIAPYKLPRLNNKLNDYFLSNLTISKQWNRQLGSYIYISNIFNEKYHMWNNYLAPDLTCGAGLRYFW